MMVVLGLLVILFVTLPVSGTSALAAPPITKVLKRRHDLRKDPPNRAEIAELRRLVQQDQNKKSLKTGEFKDMPVKYHEIRNLNTDTWYKDLQIEVKNIGSKPIYFMLAYLEFPDHKPGGRDTGLSLTFGDLKNWDIGTIADPHDLHIDPGQTYVFTIPEENRKWLQKQNEKVPQELKKLDFHIDIISFGDRTGFEIGRPLDLRQTKQPEARGNKKHHATNLSVSAVDPVPQDGCGSCSRLTTQPANTCFDLAANNWCAPKPLRKVDSSRPCGFARVIFIGCYSGEAEDCPADVIYIPDFCPGYVPTPTPTPTPEESPTPTPSPTPTCDPATKPNEYCHCEPWP